jgi:hypothetical protein
MKTADKLFQIGRNCTAAAKQRVFALQTSKFRWLVDIPVALFFGRDLKALATVYGSDKWNVHRYAQHYETHFHALRGRRINLLEIGIGGYDDPRRGGRSLRMWRTWFRGARIHGIDIFDKSLHNERRITTHRGSQTDAVFLNAVIDKIGRVDIVIDDGSHDSADVIATFGLLFPRLADGGYYAVEDTQTSYWPHEGNVTERNSPHTTMGFFKSLVDGLNWEEYFGDYEPTYLDLNIAAIHFYHNLIVIKKGENREGSNNRQWNRNKPEWNLRLGSPP